MGGWAGGWVGYLGVDGECAEAGAAVEDAELEDTVDVLLRGRLGG